MAGGGKTSENKTEINPRLAAASGPAIDRAEDISKLPYMANRGIQYAAFTPDQEAAFANTNNAASAYGLDTGGGTGLPEAETVNGFRGYSSAPLYDDMLDKSVPQGAQEYIADMFHDFSQGNPNDKVKPARFTDEFFKSILSSSRGDDWAGQSVGYNPTGNQRAFNESVADRAGNFGGGKGD